MRRFALGLALLLCGSPVWATPWFFSGCASGGVGTQSSPFCLDPGGSGTRKSFEYLMDGVGNEAACGDTIFLCAGSTGGAGDCDGTGTDYWFLQPHVGKIGNGSTPLVDVDAQIDCPGSPITIKPYCNGANCETVVVSGDVNNNGVYDSGTDAQIFFNAYSTAGGDSGKTGYVFVGDPNGDFACTPTFTGPGNTPIPTTCTGANLIIEKIANNNFYFGGSWGGVLSVTGTEDRYGGAGAIGVIPSTTNAYFVAATPGCSGCTGIAGDGGFVDQNILATAVDALLDTYATFITGGLGNNIDVTLQNNYLHHNAQIGWRYNNNCLASKGGNADWIACTLGPHLILVDQNVGHIIHAFGDGHQGRNFTFSKNVMTDMWGGLGIENHERNILIEDNILAALPDATMGITSATSMTPPAGNFGRFGPAIYVTDNNEAGAHCNETDGDCSDNNCYCVSYGITIRRNKVFGQGECTTSGAKCGNRAASTNYMIGGIIVNAHNVDAAGQNGGRLDSVIEDNVVIHQQQNNTCSVTEPWFWSIAVRTSDQVTVRNNTVFDSSCPMLIGGGGPGSDGGTGAVQHTVTNNIVVQTKGYGNSGIGNNPEFVLWTDAATSFVQNNIFHYGIDGTGTVVCKDQDGLNNSCTGTDIPLTCANINSGGSPGPTLGLANGGANKCAQPTFLNTSGQKSTWDLHLNSGDTEAKDMGTAFGSCATLDVDGMTRSGNGAACDIGADELSAAPPPVKRRVLVTTGS